MDFEWTNDTVIRLVKEYKHRPHLWDTTHAMYRTNQIKYESWSELANIFEVDVADVRKKLNSVLASYRREKARVRTGQRSTWFLYQHLSFLPTHVDDSHLDGDVVVLPDQKKPPAVRILNNTICSDAYSEPQDDQSDQDDDIEVMREEIIIKDEPEEEIIRQPLKKTRPMAMAANSRRLKPIRTIRSIKKKIPIREVETPQPTQSHQSERIVAEVLRLLRRSDQNKRKDSCDSFGEYIADSLRKHDEKTQAMIKQAINNIIFEQEMQKYKKSNEYTVVISAMEQNPLVSENSDDEK